MLRAGRLIAAELAGEAIDLEAVLTMADRLALATLSLAIDLEVSARAGVEPCTITARAWLADELALIEATAAHPLRVA
jgi:hypothetical protein